MERCRLAPLQDYQYDYPSFSEILNEWDLKFSQKSRDVLTSSFSVYVDILDMFVTKGDIFVIFDEKEVCVIHLNDAKFEKMYLSDDEKTKIIDKYFVYIIYCALTNRYLRLKVPQIIYNIITRVVFNICRKRKKNEQSIADEK